MAFSDRLETLRRERGLSQAQLSAKADVNPVQLSRYEVGSAKPNIDIVKRLCVALNVSADELLFDPSERRLRRDLSLTAEAISKLPKAQRDALRTVIEAVVAEHERRVEQASRGGARQGRPRGKKR